MEHNTQQRLDYWNRKITNACWLIVLFSVIIELLMSLVSKTPMPIFLFKSVFIPTVYMLIIMICIEIALRYLKQFADYINITACLLLAAVIFWVHVSVPPVQGVLLTPFLFSIFYFRKSRVIFACIATIIMTCFLYLSHEHFNDEHISLYLYSAVGIIFFAYFIALSVMKRGIELLDHLKTTMNAQQELVIKNALMDRASKIDALTDCYNHKTFHEYLDNLIEQSESNPLPLHLAILDIDNFKTVNDTYGHWIGDIVLKSLALRLRELVTPHDFVTRYGGEEFAVIFTDKTFEEAYQISENVRLQIAATKYPELDDQSVTVSIGLQSYEKGTGKEKLFKDADDFLYMSKKTGKNKITSASNIS